MTLDSTLPLLARNPSKSANRFVETDSFSLSLFSPSSSSSCSLGFSCLAINAEAEHALGKRRDSRVETINRTDRGLRGDLKTFALTRQNAVPRERASGASSEAQQRFTFGIYRNFMA